MNLEIARAYDRTPYPDYAFWATHPDHLGMFGRLFGVPAAPSERCRVLEIGCAVGGNILPMAATLSGSQFIGVDLSGVQIARAVETASAIDLDNITFIHGDFREVSARGGPFDYIICHGVFAWVDGATQAALLAFIHERLAPNGVAFVSYNTYPGHHMVDMVRKVLAVHTANAPDLVTKNEQAIAVMRFLHRMSKKVEGDWRTGFFEREIRQMQDAGLDLLEHDYCALQSQPLYFRDFVKSCDGAGLAYLADSSPWGMYLDNQSPEIVETLRPLGDLVMQGQYLDFLQHTRYRETLICQATAPLTRDVPAGRVQQFHIGHALAAEPLLDGLRESLPVQVVVARRPPLTVSSPIIRLALHRLWHHGRWLPTFDQLADEVAQDLDSHGIDSVDRATLRERLSAQLLRAFFANAVRFSTRCPPVAQSLPERPATGAYQRFMAREKRPGITTLTHEVFEATPLMHALLPHLDGTRSLADLEALCPEPLAASLAELKRKGFVLAPVVPGTAPSA